MRQNAMLWVIFVIIISGATIFFQSNLIPKYLAHDEVDFIQVALDLEHAPYTPYTPAATGHTTLYFYVILFFFKIFGVSQFSLRFASGTSGVIGAVFFYLISREIFKTKILNIDAAFIVTLIFITMRWYFSFARYAFEASFLLMFELIALYVALRFRKTQSTLLLLIAVIFTGLAYNSYTPGRFFVLLIGALIFLSSQKRFLHMSVFIGFFALLIAPLTLYFTQYPDIRISQQLYLANTDLSLIEKIFFFLQNIWKNIYMLFGQGDFNGRHNYPYKAALNPILFSFFLLGVINSLRKKSGFFHYLFGAYFLLALLPTLLTYPHENPNMLRTFTMLPAIAYFAGQGILWIYGQVKGSAQKTRIVGIFLLGAILLSSLYEIRTYFVFQKLVYIQAFDVVFFMDPKTGRVMRKLANPPNNLNLAK